MIPVSTRRALLLGLVLAATACDLARLATSDPPQLEQTWNLPGPDTRMSVADLLPPGKVSILTGAAAAAEGLADSAAFSMSMDPTNFAAQLGPNCPACLPLNGTNSNKPAFTMAPGNSTALPTDVVSAAILSGRISVALINNLTFDPLYVNTGGGSPPQGTLLIVVRSGPIVLGRDSIRGAVNTSVSQAGCATSPCNMPFNPAQTINRTIQLTTGSVNGSITVDVTVNSPAGDHPVPIDVSKFFNSAATVTAINVASVNMKVPGRTFDSGSGESIEVPASGSSVKSLGLDMTITNPFAGLTGGLNLIFAYGPGPAENITKAVTLPTGTATSNVVLSPAETQTLLGGDGISIKLTGNVSAPPATTIIVTPKQEVKVANRIRLTVQTGGQ